MIEARTQAEWSRPMSPAVSAGEQVQRVLDVMEVTDRVYHELYHTRPMVDALLQEVGREVGPGRALLVAPNELLAQVLQQAGWEVDIWRVEGCELSAETDARASRRGSLDEVLAVPPGERRDLLVVPYTLESCRDEPAEVLFRLLQGLAPDGRVVASFRQAGSLFMRRRILAGMPPVPPLPEGPARFSLTWPELPLRRALGVPELRSAATAAGLRVRHHRLVVDRQAVSAVQAMGLGRWLRLNAQHLAKRALPAIRDVVVATLVMGGER